MVCKLAGNGKNVTLTSAEEVKVPPESVFLCFITKVACTKTSTEGTNHHFFSAFTLGLKKDDIVFMPLLSTFARFFCAAVIFLGGCKETKKTSNDMSSDLPLKETRRTQTQSLKVE